MPMPRRQLLALSGALLAGSLAGCAGNPLSGDGGTAQAAPGAEPDIDDEDLRALVHQTNGFAFDLYRALLDERRDDNVFASPVSIAVALAMAYAGTRNETRDQMREALRYPIEDEAVHEAFNALQRELNARGEDVDDVDGFEEDDDPVPFELSIVNALWGQADYPFEEDYLDLVADHYGGGLEAVDFTADPAGVREEINAWVADRTDDRIDEVLPPDAIDDLVRLVLVNAMYFLANWKHPFNESRTELSSFTAIDGTEHDVPMMASQRRWRHAQFDGTEVVELPYVGDEAAMLVILPPEGAFESYEAAFDGEELQRLIDALERREGTVGLPRFEFETSLELASVLEELGMEDAFDPDRADFGGLAHPEADGRDLHIDGVYHDAFVVVDEMGTEAAAATAVVISDTSAPKDPFTFVADRPFLFVIRDRPTDTVLFLGRVVDPAEWA